MLGYVIAGEGWKTRAQLARRAVDGRDEDQEEHGMPKLLQNRLSPGRTSSRRIWSGEEY